MRPRREVRECVFSWSIPLYSESEIVDHVSKIVPASWAIGTFSTIAVTLRFLVKSGAQLGGLNRLITSPSDTPPASFAPTPPGRMPARNLSPRQLSASPALALP